MNQRQPTLDVNSANPRRQVADDNGIAQWTGWRIAPNTVVRQACDRCGRVLDYFAAPHDGTPEGMIAAAQRVSDEMFLVEGEASNINSAILATDEAGAPHWTISPNFRLIEEISQH